MPITKTYQVYKFDELPAEAQEKALDKNRFINVDDSSWYDYVGKTGFSEKEIKRHHLELENSGDLLNYKDFYFDIDRGWYIQFIDARFDHDETARRFLGVPKALWEQVHWKFINRNFGGNSHATTNLEYESQDIYKEFTSKQIEVLNRAVERFAEKMEEALNNLRSVYYDMLSDESIKETFEANDYYFTIDGRIETA